MSDLDVHVCPETGICSIIKEDGSKVDLMPTEVGEIKGSADNSDAIRKSLAAIDSGFAEGLAPEELDQISKALS